jgi:excisionase family DNA binding protein
MAEVPYLRRDYLKENVRLTSRDIAAYCQVSKSTVLEWIKSGRLKAFSLPSGHYRIDRRDFREFLERWNIPVRKWLFGHEQEEGNKSAVEEGQKAP